MPCDFRRSNRRSFGYTLYDLMRSGHHERRCPSCNIPFSFRYLRGHLRGRCGEQFRWTILHESLQREANASADGLLPVSEALFLMERAKAMTPLQLTYHAETYLEEQSMYQALDQLHINQGNNAGSPMEISTPVNTPVPSPDIVSPPESAASDMGL